MKWKQFWRIWPFLVVGYIIFDYFVLSSSKSILTSVLVGLIMGLLLIVLRIVLDMIKVWKE